MSAPVAMHADGYVCSRMPEKVVEAASGRAKEGMDFFCRFILKVLGIQVIV
jgi:hypothetical protein